MWIKWFKLNPKAKIPTKSKFAAGFDVYTIDEDVVLKPHTNHLFATGLAFFCEEGYWLGVEDRGSTGSKNLHYHCGVLDTDYRGEIFVCINNDNDYPVKFTNNEAPGFHTRKETRTVEKILKGTDTRILSNEEVSVVDYFVYPVLKAIAQIVPYAMPEVESSEATLEEWEAAKNTERGEGKLGSSGR